MIDDVYPRRWINTFSIGTAFDPRSGSDVRLRNACAVLKLYRDLEPIYPINLASSSLNDREETIEGLAVVSPTRQRRVYSRLPRALCWNIVSVP